MESWELKMACKGHHSQFSIFHSPFTIPYSPFSLFPFLRDGHSLVSVARDFGRHSD